MWELRIESSRDGLPALLATRQPPGLFVYDGWHSYEATCGIRGRGAAAAGRGALVSDDADSGAMVVVCERHGLRYMEVAERPKGDFYPGSRLAAGRRGSGH